MDVIAYSICGKMIQSNSVSANPDNWAVPTKDGIEYLCMKCYDKVKNGMSE